MGIPSFDKIRPVQNLWKRHSKLKAKEISKREKIKQIAEKLNKWQKKYSIIQQR